MAERESQARSWSNQDTCAGASGLTAPATRKCSIWLGLGNMDISFLWSGILRPHPDVTQHAIFENGTVRDTVVCSMVEAEWPTMKFGLVERLSALQR